MKRQKNIKRPMRCLNVAIALCAVALICVCAWQFTLSRADEYAAREYAALSSLFETALAQNGDGEELSAAHVAAQSAADKRAADEPEGQAAYQALSGGAISKSAADAFDQLRGQNSAVVGWIKGAGTKINYPIMRGSNNTYYQDHLYNGKSNRTGAIFMDAKNDASFSDQNTILYGHHMRNGSMFASLVNYQKPAYYRAHPTLTLHTPDGSYSVELFAGYTINADKSEAPGFRFNFVSDQSFADFVAAARKKSTFKSDVRVAAGDRVLTLCTCTYELYNSRYVLHGKLTPLS